MLEQVRIGEVMESQGRAISREEMEAFARVTHSDRFTSVPLTLATVLRKPEFDWLAGVKVNLANLLHTEQEYEYRAPFRSGATSLIRTTVEDLKERTGKQGTIAIIVLKSEILFNGEISVVSKTTFMVRGS